MDVSIALADQLHPVFSVELCFHLCKTVQTSPSVKLFLKICLDLFCLFFCLELNQTGDFVFSGHIQV